MDNKDFNKHLKLAFKPLARVRLYLGVGVLCIIILILNKLGMVDLNNKLLYFALFLGISCFVLAWLGEVRNALITSAQLKVYPELKKAISEEIQRLIDIIDNL